MLIFDDCNIVLPDLKADICVTSPPYNLNKRASGGGSSKRNYEGWYPDDLPENEYQEWQKKTISQLIKTCSSSIFYNHRIRYAWHSRNTYRTASRVYHPMDWLKDFPIWSEIVWDRGGTTGHANGRFRMSNEMVYQIKKPSVFHDLGLTSVWKIPPSKNDGHVCSFPEKLVENCILSTTNEGDTVIDPFMGSGTVGLVCKRLNRNFIGIEKDETFFKIAQERLK